VYKTVPANKVLLDNNAQNSVKLKQEINKPRCKQNGLFSQGIAKVSPRIKEPFNENLRQVYNWGGIKRI